MKCGTCTYTSLHGQLACTCTTNDVAVRIYLRLSNGVSLPTDTPTTESKSMIPPPLSLASSPPNSERSYKPDLILSPDCKIAVRTYGGRYSAVSTPQYSRQSSGPDVITSQGQITFEDKDKCTMEQSIPPARVGNLTTMHTMPGSAHIMSGTGNIGATTAHTISGTGHMTMGLSTFTPHGTSNSNAPSHTTAKTGTIHWGSPPSGNNNQPKTNVSVSLIPSLSVAIPPPMLPVFTKNEVDLGNLRRTSPHRDLSQIRPPSSADTGSSSLLPNTSMSVPNIAPNIPVERNRFPFDRKSTLYASSPQVQQIDGSSSNPLASLPPYSASNPPQFQLGGVHLNPPTTSSPQVQQIDGSSSNPLTYSASNPPQFQLGGVHLNPPTTLTTSHSSPVPPKMTTSSVVPKSIGGMVFGPSSHQSQSVEEKTSIGLEMTHAGAVTAPLSTKPLAFAGSMLTSPFKSKHIFGPPPLTKTTSSSLTNITTSTSEAPSLMGLLNKSDVTSTALSFPFSGVGTTASAETAHTIKPFTFGTDSPLQFSIGSNSTPAKSDFTAAITQTLGTNSLLSSVGSSSAPAKPGATTAITLSQFSIGSNNPLAKPVTTSITTTSELIFNAPVSSATSSSPISLSKGAVLGNKEQEVSSESDTKSSLDPNKSQVNLPIYVTKEPVVDGANASKTIVEIDKTQNTLAAAVKPTILQVDTEKLEAFSTQPPSISVPEAVPISNVPVFGQPLTVICTAPSSVSNNTLPFIVQSVAGSNKANVGLGINQQEDNFDDDTMMGDDDMEPIHGTVLFLCFCFL